ncbi:MAG: hypothetical protein H0X31_02735 [Nostocaceae cyanobacterium]|nr:hypothetical protein [Nostocaceae cyanobacterium]
MKTLVGYYQEIKDKLKSQLEAATTTEQVVKIVQSEINQLIDINGEYIQSLTPPQARLARVMLQALNQYTNVLISVKLHSPSEIEKPASQLDLTKLTSDVLSPVTKMLETQKNLQTMTSPAYYQQVLLQQVRQSREIVSSLLAGGLAGTFEGGLYWGLFGAIVGAVTGGVFTRVFKKEPVSADISVPTPVLALPQSRIEIDTNKILDYLYQAWQSIDLTVAAYGGKEEKAVKPGLEDNLDLLEYLQDLMADALDENIQLPIAVRRRIQQAKTILRRQGIEARVYQPDTEQEWSMFYFEPSLDPEVTEYVTLKPALVKGTQVILLGSVIEPALLAKK